MVSLFVVFKGSPKKTTASLVGPLPNSQPYVPGVGWGVVGWTQGPVGGWVTKLWADETKRFLETHARKLCLMTGNCHFKRSHSFKANLKVFQNGASGQRAKAWL